MVFVYHIWHTKKAQYVPIEQPCGYTDAMLRKRYLAGRDVPVWWLGWHSTQAWLAMTVQRLDNELPGLEYFDGVAS